MGREGGLLRLPRFTPSTTPMPSRYASLDGGKEVEPSDSSLSSSLEDWSGKDRKGWQVGLKKKGCHFGISYPIWPYMYIFFPPNCSEQKSLYCSGINSNHDGPLADTVHTCFSKCTHSLGKIRENYLVITSSCMHIIKASSETLIFGRCL